MTERKTGTIKKVLKGRSCGFISVPGEKDVFFPFTKFRGFVKEDQLKEGETEVSFSLGPGNKGDMIAVDIEVLSIENHPSKRNIAPKRPTPPKPSSGDKLFLPKDTAELLAGPLPHKSIDNFSIRLNRCPMYNESQEKFILHRKSSRDHAEYWIGHDFTRAPLKEINARYEQSLEKLHLVLARSIFLSLDWQMILGLGQESVYETSMTLHHIYGIPYIPGQAIKGCVRNWVILEKFGGSEKGALKDQGFCDIFGYQKESHYKQSLRGRIVFFDALPTFLGKESIHADIMNPHYGPYYAGEKPPADYHDPVPVTFLTLQNASFQFHLGASKRENRKIENHLFKNREPLEVARDCLKSALTEYGIGAKTASGYGYFRKSANG